MLQQTRVETGIDYFNRFLTTLPTVQALAAADEDTVLKLWEGLGYYSRARNLQKAARWIVNEQKGCFPESAREWQALPGVGRYTAAAIASITVGERVAVLDGNVKRVLARLTCLEDCIDEGPVTEKLWALADSLVPRRTKTRWPGDWNEAMMEFGATVCIPKRPRCETCPLQSICQGYAAEMQSELPVRRAKKPIPTMEVAAVLLKHRGKLLIGKRPHGSMLAGLWELPGGRVHAGESPAGALERILRDTTGTHIQVGKLLSTIDHTYSHFKLTLQLYEGRRRGGRLHHRHYPELLWVAPAALEDYPMPQADRNALRAANPA
jgi:A/G-specific adenine glycosylase